MKKKDKEMDMNRNCFFVYFAFGLLVGVWLSTFIVFYVGVDMLVFVSVLGGGVCFLGFVFFWGKFNSFRQKVIYENNSGGFVGNGRGRSGGGV